MSKSRERDNRKTFQNSNHVLEEKSNENSDDLCFIFIKIQMENRNHC